MASIAIARCYNLPRYLGQYGVANQQIALDDFQVCELCSHHEVTQAYL
jgi:hypothetical protein